MSIFSPLKKLLGPNLTNKIRPIGHGFKTYLAALYFGFPAKKLKLIAITGTKGKTTTSIFTARLMNLAGLKTGLISTALISVDGYKEILNPYKMTSVDGYHLHKYLKEMVKNGCQYAVLEMSSQGLEQNRHWGLGKFDAGIFLNIYPEHIEAHGSFENYQKAKSILFKNLKKNGVFIGNSNVDMLERTEYMYQACPQPVKKLLINGGVDYQIQDYPASLYKFIKTENELIETKFIADFEVDNIMFAHKAVQVYKPEFDLKANLSSLNTQVPGRMQWVVRDNILQDFV